MKFSVGWTVVAVSFVVLATSFAYRNLLQLTMTGMEAELGWSRSLLSSGATFALIAMAAGNLFGGMLVDRYGPRKLLASGLVALGIGMLGVGLTSSAWLYVVLYGAFAGLGFGLVANSIVSAAVARFFVERRGFALGVASAGGPVGQMVLIPLSAVVLTTLGWITSAGWRLTYTASAARSCVIRRTRWSAMRPFCLQRDVRRTSFERSAYCSRGVRCVFG